VRHHCLPVLLATLVVGLGAAVAACGGPSPPPPTPTVTAGQAGEYRDAPAPEKPAEGRAVGRSDFIDSPLTGPLERFGYDLLAREAKTTDDDVVLSPASIHAALAMTLNGAEGETAAEMRRALAIDGLDAQTVNQAWADVIASADATEGVQIRIADSLWMREWAKLRPEFVKTNGDFYAASTSPLADDPAQAAGDINAWVEERTGGRIKDLVNEVDPAVFLVLVNAIYVKAGWEQFDEEATREEPFALADGAKVDVDMMNGGADLYAETAEYEAVKLDTNGPVAMWVVVPKGSRTPESLLPQLRERGLTSLGESGETPVIHLALPRFRIEYTADGLVEELKGMGMSRAFSADQAEFGRMTEVRPAWIDQIAHKAFLEVNEEGVEAAAGTAVMMPGAGAPTGDVYVRADRPFLVVLTQTNTGDVPLFMAIVRDPR